ncbi:MAG: hypothetical protein QM500_03975, partial [Methylococcales bacterium]
FSKRQKQLRGEVPDVYTYDELPRPLKVQIVHIITDTLGNSDGYYSHRAGVKSAYTFIVKTLCHEYGLFRLPGASEYESRMYLTELTSYFLQEKDVDKCIDVIEMSFKVIDKFTRRHDYLYKNNGAEIADNSITELNERFKEHGIGFQFIENEVIRVDSELIHVEAVKPALRLLNQKNYQGAQQEFLSAYEHYRHGKNKESLNDCLKAFESTMKAICDKRKWKYKSSDTARSLIQVCFENELVPTFWQQQLTSLRSILESSIPTGRNKLSGHGQGSEPITVPNYLVAYMLHMTASTLVFLTTAEENLA